METTLQHTCKTLRHLTPEQLRTRIGSSTAAELLEQLPADLSDTCLNKHQVFLLGRLSLMLDILDTRQRRPVLVRWFD